MEHLHSASQAALKLKLDRRATPSDTMDTASTDVEIGPEPDILFVDVKDVFTQIERTDGDAIVVGNISVTAFQALKQRRDENEQNKLRLFYLAEFGCAIITVPTLEHEEMHGWLYQHFLIQVGKMGDLWRDWRGTLAGEFPGPGGSSGEGDSGGQPRSMRNLGEWPTLVIEAGYTQTMPSLYAKMRWWFSASDHAVKVVLLVKYFRSETRIHIERWQEQISRPGATATRWATRAGLVQPQCQQTIDVCWASSVAFTAAPETLRRDPSSFRVMGEPLTIAFAAVFLRPPGVGEHEFVFPDDDLRLLATSLVSRQ